MRGWLLALGICLAFALQTAVAPLFSPFGLTPDLMLLMVIAIGLLKGPVMGMGFGLVGGLLFDCQAGGIIGVHALADMLIGFACGLMEKTIFKDNLFIPLLAAWFSTLVQEILIGLILLAFRWRVLLLYTLWRYTIPLMFYHALLAPAVYYLIYRVERRLMLRNT